MSFANLLSMGSSRRKATIRRHSSCKGAPRRLSYERLEDRALLTIFTVTNLNDVSVTAAGQAPGTLRQAIFDANQSPDADIIQFSAGLSGTIQLAHVGDAAQGSALLISSPITIRGNASGITIGRDSAAVEMRLFRVAPGGNLTLETISLTNGIARGANGTAPGVPGNMGRGGAVLNQGMLQVVSSTIHGNSAIGGNGMSADPGRAIGAGISNDGGTVVIRNSTLSSNTATSGSGSMFLPSYGGGIHSANGTLQVYNSTIAFNSSSTGREIYVQADSGPSTFALHSTIAAQQTSEHSTVDVVILEDLSGTVALSASNNVIRRQLGMSSASHIAENPLLGPLAHNGGPTMTHEISALSPAVDAGTNTLGLPTDQRGSSFARQAGLAVDIGAFERQSGSTLLSGDYNGDLAVNAADYVLWRKTLNATVTSYSGADGNGTGTIDPGDFQVWQANFGRTSASGTGQDDSAAFYATEGLAPPVIDTKPTHEVDRSVAVASTTMPTPEAIDRALAALLWSESLPKKRAISFE